jgi:hypothetical protein
MTTANKVSQTLSSLIGAQSSLQMFAVQSTDGKAKMIFEQAAEEIQPIIQSLKERLKQMETEEPQYQQEESP